MNTIINNEFLIKQWDYNKNSHLSPEKLKTSSHKKAWWLCKEGHSYEMTIGNKYRQNSGCPYCSNRKVLKGFNDLATTHPELLKEWDYNKNTIKPEEISYGSKKKVFWLCNNGHSYQQTIFSKTGKKYQNCPYCTNRKVLEGFNDLATTHPELLKEWDYNKNTIKPEEVSRGSNKKIWWLCNNGHSYQQTIFSKTGKKYQNCPYCTNRKVLSGFNDLATTHPDISSQWDYHKNDTSPQDYTYGSTKKVWWICDKGHSWLAAINKRTAGHKCIYCTNREVLPGFNDFVTLYPEIAQEWDYSKNDKSPHKIFAGARYNAWWICDKGHSYQQLMYARTKQGQGCPYCCNQKIISGYNDLHTLSEDLMNEWDYSKNDIDPTTIANTTRRKVWWKCSNEHSWLASIHYRNVDGKGNPCPSCGSMTSINEKELQEYVQSIYKGEILCNDRKTLNGLELDIYIPDKKISIEYNGLYWHSEKFVDKNYHYNKWKQCANLNIQLITIWEDDWNNKQEIIKNMLSYKLGVAQQEKIHARNTYVKDICFKKAQQFTEKYHIQGSTRGSMYLGLYDKNDELVAVSIWKNNNNALHLERYCTNKHVIGGMGKMLKRSIFYAQENNIPCIVTFADNQTSDGNLYKTLGFTVENNIRPDYSYVYKNKRIHKFNFRKNRFKNDNNLLYEDNLTEHELALLNNIYRVYDCGKVKWKITVL